MVYALSTAIMIPNSIPGVTVETLAGGIKIKEWYIAFVFVFALILQYFDTVGRMTGEASSL